MTPRLPWSYHPALTEDRLVLAARLLVRGRNDALARAEPEAGDDAWSVGCRAYSFSRHQLNLAAGSGRHPWLRVLDASQHFVFLIDGIPVRFYRGPADGPSERTLTQQEREAAQMSMAFGPDGDHDGLLFRLAVETRPDGRVDRVVFLALRGEVADCAWPVPLDLAEPLPAVTPFRSRGAQLAFLPAASALPRKRVAPRRVRTALLKQG